MSTPFPRTEAIRPRNEEYRQPVTLEQAGNLAYKVLLEYEEGGNLEGTLEKVLPGVFGCKELPAAYMDSMRELFAGSAATVLKATCDNAYAPERKMVQLEARSSAVAVETLIQTVIRGLVYTRLSEAAQFTASPVDTYMQGKGEHCTSEPEYRTEKARAKIDSYFTDEVFVTMMASALWGSGTAPNLVLTTFNRHSMSMRLAKKELKASEGRYGDRQEVMRLALADARTTINDYNVMDSEQVCHAVMDYAFTSYADLVVRLTEKNLEMYPVEETAARLQTLLADNRDQIFNFMHPIVARVLEKHPLSPRVKQEVISSQMDPADANQYELVDALLGLVPASEASQ